MMRLVFLLLLVVAVYSYRFQDDVEDDNDDDFNMNNDVDESEDIDLPKSDAHHIFRRGFWRRESRSRKRCKPCKRRYRPTQHFPVWRQLSVTYRKFTKMPMNTRQARKMGWVPEENGCKDDLFFVGRRYTLKQKGGKSSWDRSTILLYDVYGHIAGIQMEIPAANKIDQVNRFPPFIVGASGARYLTAYFTDPQYICNKKVRRDSRMVGDRLMILNSNKTLPDGSLLNIPLRESWMDGTKWSKGGCVPAMGRHYFYDMSPNMKCADFIPMFLLYNKGVLNGFGWTMGGHINSATGRLEYAPNALLRKFFEPGIKWPVCLDDRSVSQPSVSSQHVYLDVNPEKNLC